MPKRDRYGVFLKMETLALELATLVITAAFQGKNQKGATLERARITVELLKRLCRVCHELSIITQKFYLLSELELQEISKMLNGWMRYLRS